METRMAKWKIFGFEIWNGVVHFCFDGSGQNETSNTKS
jgi:hypothetical protein